jgi:hypothetical protein
MPPGSYMMWGAIGVATVLGSLALTMGFAIIPLIAVVRVAALLIVAIAIWRIVIAMDLERWIAVAVSGACIFFLYVDAAPFFGIRLRDLETFFGPFVMIVAAFAVWRVGSLMVEAARHLNYRN